MRPFRPLLTAFLVAGLAGCTTTATSPRQAAPTTTSSASASPTSNPSATSHPTAPPTAGWPALRGLALNDVQAVGERLAFVVGDHLILRTTDSGRSWQRLYGGPQQLNQVDMINSRVGWAVGGGALLRTVDGLSWQPVGEPSGASLDRVHFVSSRDGIGLGRAGSSDTGLLFRTGDGGDHWQRMSSPVPPLAVTANSPSLLWVAGDDQVWRSRDAGRTWQRRLAHASHKPYGSGEAVRYGAAEAYAAGPDAVWIEFAQGEGAAGQQPWVLYQGGDTRPVQEVQQGPGSSYPDVISPLSAMRAVVVANCPACDGPAAAGLVDLAGRGSSLSDVAVALPAALSFGSRAVGYLLGRPLYDGHADPPPVIAVTRDGGRSWHVGPP